MKARSIGLCLAFLSSVALPLAADSGKPEIRQLEATRLDSRLAVSFLLEGAFDGATLERIQSGLPTGFDYELRLERTRKWWFNKGVDRVRFKVVAMYNAITREYLVNYKLDGDLIDSRVVMTDDELEQAITSFHQVDALEVPDTARGRLVLRVRAELGPKTLLGIIPTHAHTDWAESVRFTPAQTEIHGASD